MELPLLSENYCSIVEMGYSDGKYVPFNKSEILEPANQIRFTNLETDLVVRIFKLLFYRNMCSLKAAMLSAVKILYI